LRTEVSPPGPIANPNPLQQAKRKAQSADWVLGVRLRRTQLAALAPSYVLADQRT
jgi:hypothetical protein